MSCLGLSMRKSRSSILLLKYLATTGDICVFPSRYLSTISSSFLLSSSFNVPTTVSIINSLKTEKVWQCRRKQVQSSTVGQKGHFLSIFSKFKCLPFSIINLWFDKRNLLIEILSLTFLTDLRQGSSPASFFIKLYVLNLLDSFLISVNPF